MLGADPVVAELMGLGVGRRDHHLSLIAEPFEHRPRIRPADGEPGDAWVPPASPVAGHGPGHRTLNPRRGPMTIRPDRTPATSPRRFPRGPAAPHGCRLR